MKNVLFFFGIVCMMFLVSCHRHREARMWLDEGETVTLRVNLPDDIRFRTATRALPDVPEGYALRCILEVWDERKTTLLRRYEEVALEGKLRDGFEFSFELPVGVYECLFWADYVMAGTGESRSMPNAYTHYPDNYYATDGTDGLKAVAVRREFYELNTALRDAFSGKYVLNKTADATLLPAIPPLTRPFARLTFIEENTEHFEWCKTMNVEYNVPEVFNVSTKTASGNFRVARTGLKPLGEEVEQGRILLYDYIFCPGNSTLGEVLLSFEAKDGRKLCPAPLSADIPLQCNHRTNAVGTLIIEDTKSEEVSLSIRIDSEWEEEVIVYNIKHWDGALPAADPAYPFAAKEDGTHGDGTKTNPYLIASAMDLTMLSANVGAGNTYSGKYFEQTADIDLTPAYNWVPIGNVTKAFAGKYDGKSHQVELAISAMPANASYIGLFYKVSGEIKNLNITGKITLTIEGINELRVASLCALGDRGNEKIENCHSDCHIVVTGNARGQVVIGGLSAYASGIYNNNSYSGYINSSGVEVPELHVGGLIGYYYAYKNQTYTGNNVSDDMKQIGWCVLSHLDVQPPLSYTLTVDGEQAQDEAPWPLD